MIKQNPIIFVDTIENPPLYNKRLVKIKIMNKIPSQMHLILQFRKLSLMLRKITSVGIKLINKSSMKYLKKIRKSKLNT